MTAADEPRRLRADAARNRQALIDAAQRLFAGRGLAVTLDDIAAAAGVNVATAYRHFANKHELADAFMEQLIEQSVAVLEAATDAPDPWRGLVGMFDGISAIMESNRGLHDVFTPGHAEQWLRRLDERAEPLLRRLLRRAQDAGAVRPEIRTADIGVIFQMLATVHEIPARNHRAMRGRYLALILDGLRPGGSALPGSPPSKAELRAATAATKTRRSRAGRPTS